jgi:M6 family metalloprotease-like protein
MAPRRNTLVLLASMLAGHFVHALPLNQMKMSNPYNPFEVLDPQVWVNPDNMTWNDFKAPPNTNWSDPSRKGSIRNFNIALVAVDYSDQPFVISLAPNSTVFSNPQPVVSGVNRSDVPAFYRDLLNTPSELNRGHTLHEYWMEDSAGQYGVNLQAFGAYKLPSLSYQYGVDDSEGGYNPGACPSPGPCLISIRTDALKAWRANVDNDVAKSFELVFILSAGQDESSTWQEFGEMRFQTKEDVPDSFGPPDAVLTNYARTRYVEWTSWASASTIWPNAGADSSSTQAESSGLATYAHELSHLLGIGDNYNNPYSIPARRSFTGPWSMTSRGSFNGPGGPHTRWQIPALHGGSLGSLHTVRDKQQIKLITDNSSILTVTRESLANSSLLLVAELTARSVDPGKTNLLSLRVVMGKDLSPFCNVSTNPLCDGGGYNNYELEVIDRMGADSFTPDSGVMISKTKDKDIAPFQWTIDANPQDINLVDFYRPNGTQAKVTIGDYRQLADALFHAGTRSGSESEYVDKPNRLHFYVLGMRRDEIGVLHYTVGVRSLDSPVAATAHIEMVEGEVEKQGGMSPTREGVTCTFKLRNPSTPTKSIGALQNSNSSMGFASDVFRLSAEVDGDGWRVEVPNAFAFARLGEWTVAEVAVGASQNASSSATITLTAASELDPSVKTTTKCYVNKY